MAGALVWTIGWTLFRFLLISLTDKGSAEYTQGAVFLPEFTLIHRESYPDELLGDQIFSHRSEDQSLRMARSEEDKDSQWDAWGPWSECSRTCGGGASYSLRRCLNSRNCEGRNIRYRTCSSVICPPEAGDFRAQQCSAYNDVKYQGQYHDWLPVYNDPDKPCALKCQPRGTAQVVELAPKVLDGTRCYTETLHMCISGNCQVVGCDHQLRSSAKEDNCGVCSGDGSTCRLMRGQYKSQVSVNKLDDTVIAIPYGSRHIRIVLKGPDHLYLETKTLLGQKGENHLVVPGALSIENTSLEYQKLSEKEILRTNGPLGADFTVKIKYVGTADSSVQYFFYQPIIHQWRETDFFPCSVTCSGGYQLTSAECYDLRSRHVVADRYCHYYPENIKPKPKLQECNMDPCPASSLLQTFIPGLLTLPIDIRRERSSTLKDKTRVRIIVPNSDGFKQIIPFDHYQPLPRWDSSPWTSCSSSCGGGVQIRTISCVEEDINGQINTVEEWKCMYTYKFPVVQPCNLFDCPKWLAQEWSPCTVTCGQGLRYRVVLCIDHRGLHAGGCNSKTKPHIKDECTIPVPCYKPKEKLPVEAKLPWYKQAQELEEVVAVSEEPSFIPEPWLPCSTTCGAGTQTRKVKCQVLLSFSQSVEDLPDDECDGNRPQTERACYTGPCSGETVEYDLAETDMLYTTLQDIDELYDWEYKGFTECSESCAGGVQETVVVCLNKQTRETAVESLCMVHRRPPQLLKACNLEPCPPRWEAGKWSSCSASCGVGLQTRDVICTHLLFRESNETVVLGDESCMQPKPDHVQACNRFDCLPDWHSEGWQQCSRSCGGGVQVRQLLCKQRKADGSFLDMKQELCPSPKLNTQQICGIVDCPAEWWPLKWLQCSRTCGEGVQRRDVMCTKMLKVGVSISVNSSDCFNLPRPSLLRACSAAPCTRQNRKEYKPDSRSGPHILALRKVYIQLRKEKKLQFTIGGFGYLLPKTSVIIRCPVRRARKSMITWQKDGKPLSSSSHVMVTHFGYIKINRLKPVNIGTYTCVAGPVRENFVIKLFGSNNKLIEFPSSNKQDGVIGKGILNEAVSPKENGSKSNKNGFILNHNNPYDSIILKLLEMKGWSRDRLDSRESQESMEKDFISEEDHSLEAVVPLTFTINQERLDETIRTLSQQSEELKDVYATRLIAELGTEIAGGQLDGNESNPKPNTDSTSVETTYHKATIGNRGMPKLSSVELPSSKESLHTAKVPAILQKTNEKAFPLSAEVVAYVGHTVFLASWTLKLVLQCEAEGIPQPVISWAKNGQILKYNNRIKLLPDQALQILVPSESDAGMYTCTATNIGGSDSLSSTVAVTAKPVIKGSKHDLVNTNSTSINVDVGITVKAILGANITIRCQVDGLPQPRITWTKDKSRLHANTSHFQNGSLVIFNVTLINQGLYSCHASNALGQAIETTRLLVKDPPRAFPESKELTAAFVNAGYSVHTVLATSRGAKQVLSSGNTVLVGCPVTGHPKPSISWLYNGKNLNRVSGLKHQIMASHQVLRIASINKGLQGDYSCTAQNEAGSLTQRITLEIAEYKWLLGGMMPCSAPCGNKGMQLPKLKCFQDNNIEVEKSYCKEKLKPLIHSVPCNVKDCPPRWITTTWSPCNESCGGGSESRQISCQRVTAAGILVDLSDNSCDNLGRKPMEIQACNVQRCSEWLVSNWGKCNGQCVGLRLGTKRRNILCQASNGTKLPFDQCSRNTRPASLRNCTTDVCIVHWESSSWTPCTSSCGNYGFQSRRVECVHLGSNKAVRDQFCLWKQRPANWQRCNIIPCEKSECRDTTRYCEMVKRLKLCHLSQYKLRCCESCRDL